MKSSAIVFGGSGALGKSVLKTLSKDFKTFNVDYIKSHIANHELILDSSQ